MSCDTGGTVALWSSFQQQAKSLATRNAISSNSGEITFEELYVAADRFAVSLAEAGVREGDVVALAVPNSLSLVPAALALMRLSCVVGLVSPNYRASELGAIARGVRPHCFLVAAPLAKVLDRSVIGDGARVIDIPLVGDELKLVFSSIPGSQPMLAASDAERASRVPSDAALLKFTSGSTGIPKGIVWTAANVMAEAENVVATLELTPEDRSVAAIPIVHSYGFDLSVLPLLLAGCGLTLRDQFVPRRIVADLASEDTTVFLGVPSMYRLLLQTHLASIPDLSHIRYFLSGTAHLSADFIRAFHDRFGVPICQHYGSSETGAATNHVPSEVLAHPASVGLPMRNVQLAIIDEAGQPVPSGTEGEVVVKSGAVAQGYVMGQPEGRVVLRNGEFRTGDLGIIGEDGYVYVTGRKDELINVGGFNVSPHEVTQVLESFPAVREAAVIGVRDAIGGSVVYAAVSLDSFATEQEILTHCRQHLADYKVPRRIDIITELPRGPSGKIKLRPADMAP